MHSFVQALPRFQIHNAMLTRCKPSTKSYVRSFNSKPPLSYPYTNYSCHSQASPHPSSSSSAGVSFFVAVAVPPPLALTAALSVFAALGAVGLEPGPAGAFEDPILLGRGFTGVFLAAFCALSHPAKSGSPSSSNIDFAVADDAVLDLGGLEVFTEGLAFGLASLSLVVLSSSQSLLKAPHASSASCSASSFSPASSSQNPSCCTASGAVKEAASLVVSVAFRDICGAFGKAGDAEEGRDEGTESGVADDGRSWVWLEGTAAPLARGWISPLVAAILFVKEEIAQPVQVASLLGVLMRGAFNMVEPAAATPGGAIAVSGRVWACLRTRARY